MERLEHLAEDVLPGVGIAFVLTVRDRRGEVVQPHRQRWSLSRSSSRTTRYSKSERPPGRVANGLSSIAIDFLLFALAERALFAQIISDVADWRDAFQEHLRRARPGLWVPASGGNFVMFDLGSSDAAESFARSLAERRLRIRLFPEAASFASCARVTAAPLPDLDRVLACLPV